MADRGEVEERMRSRQLELRERALSGDCAEVGVAGELDLATAGRLDELLESALQCPRHVVIDLAKCTFLDSIGIAAILRARRRMEKLGYVLCAFGASKRVDRVLDIAGLKATGLIHEDRAAALLACRRPMSSA